MGTIAEKIGYLKETKNAIKNALINKGVEVTDSDTFRSYANKISSIETGITPTGTIDITENGSYDVTNYANANVNVASSGDGTITLQQRVDEANSCRGLWSYYNGLNPELTTNLNTSNVTNMSYMFYSCTQLTSLNISNLNTSKVTDMSSMFSRCQQLTNLDLSNLNTSNVEIMKSMFSYCLHFTDLNLNNFNTSKVVNMQRMFESCLSLTGLDLSSFNTSKVTDMSYMFYKDNQIITLDLSSFDTSSVSNMNNMFFYCNSLENIIGELNLINCTNVQTMFRQCYSLTTVTLKNIKISFDSRDCTSLTLNTLINTVKELWDYSSGTTTYTLTIGSANLEKIANTYVKLITPTEEQIAQDPNIIFKLPCEVCKSTDEGAMLISEYAISKNWSVAG